MLCKHRNEFPQKKFKFIRIGRTPAEPISQVSIQIYLFRFSGDFGTNVVPSVFIGLRNNVRKKLIKSKFWKYGNRNQFITPRIYDILYFQRDRTDHNRSRTTTMA